MPSPAEATEVLRSSFEAVNVEHVSLAAAPGRVLAQEVRADRPSPACDVSAMDGFALRLADLAKGEVRVAGQATPGHPAPPLPGGAAMQIFTGAPVPAGAELVVRREDVDEKSGSIVVRDIAGRGVAGNFVRRAGENAREGALIASPGQAITPALLGAIATVGLPYVAVRRTLRVTLITTGDELVSGRDPAPWEIRDSNGPALRALLSRHEFVGTIDKLHARDDLAVLTRVLQMASDRSDVVLLTGGVSMGDFDHVPAAANAIGAETLFHRLPIRPGKPLFAARGKDGQAILGLPGNPLSVLVTARRFATAALHARAGAALPPPHLVRVANPDDQQLGLWWYRLAKLAGPGQVELLSPKSSGDVLGAAPSDGFVEIPAGAPTTGTFPFYGWA